MWCEFSCGQISFKIEFHSKLNYLNINFCISSNIVYLNITLVQHYKHILLYETHLLFQFGYFVVTIWTNKTYLEALRYLFVIFYCDIIHLNYCQRFQHFKYQKLHNCIYVRWDVKKNLISLLFLNDNRIYKGWGWFEFIFFVHMVY